MHSSKHLDIAIVGGGIGGLALAHCLSHVGIPYTLYEKAPQFGEVGAGIGLSESTYAILKNVGLGSDIEQHGCFVRDAIIVNKRARVIRKIPIQNGGFCIHRAELIRILSKRILPAQVRLGRELSDFTDDKDGVELQFKNGENAHHDWVFACDGIHSLFRKRLFPSVRKRYSGQSIWRGIATCTLPPAYQSAYLEFWGDNLRFGIIPLNSEQYYWYACKTAQQGEQDDPTTLRATLKHLYRNYAPEIVQAIDRTDHFIRNDMFDLLPHHEPWHKDRIVFL
ncbi:MAG: FAD-dependent monooxygenase, partial [Bacteroidota bacterium]